MRKSLVILLGIILASTVSFVTYFFVADKKEPGSSTVSNTTLRSTGWQNVLPAVSSGPTPVPESEFAHITPIPTEEDNTRDTPTDYWPDYYDREFIQDEKGILVASRASPHGTYHYEWRVTGDEEGSEGRPGTPLLQRLYEEIKSGWTPLVCGGYAFHACSIRIVDNRSGETVFSNTWSSNGENNGLLNPVGWIDERTVKFENAVGGEWGNEILAYDVENQKTDTVFRSECGLRGASVRLGQHRYNLAVDDDRTEWRDEETGQLLQAIAQGGTDVKDGCIWMENDGTVSMQLPSPKPEEPYEEYILEADTKLFVKQE